MAIKIMTNKIIFASIAIIGVLSFVALFHSLTIKQTVVQEVNQLSGSTSDDWNVGKVLTVTGDSFLEDTILGGGIFATSSIGDGTTTAANLCDNSLIDITPGGAQETNVNIWLSATTTLYADCLKANSDHKIVFFRNSTSTSNATATISVIRSTTGLEFNKVATSTNDIISRLIEIGRGETARLLFYRYSSATTTVFADKFR